MKSTLPISNQSETENEDLWVTSYADLISAVMAVLVLFVSFSKVDVDKMDSVHRALSDQNSCETLGEIKRSMKKTAQNCRVADQVGFDLELDGLNVNFQAALFQSGKATLDASQLLYQCDELMTQIADISHIRKIDIAGHTDDLPSKNGSNWTLSSNRANSLQQYLIKFGLSHQGVRLIAYADTKPEEAINSKMTNKEVDQARAKNRRVNIIIKDIKRNSSCY